MGIKLSARYRVRADAEFSTVEHQVVPVKLHPGRHIRRGSVLYGIESDPLTSETPLKVTSVIPVAVVLGKSIY